jgi:hypothetical protein
MYSIELTHFLKRLRLLSYLDYHVEGTTHDNGLIRISAILTSNRAIKLKPNIQTINLKINEESINIGIQQVVAENKQMVDGKIDIIKQDLATLHNKPWSTINNCGVIGLKSIRHNYKSLWMVDKPKADLKKLFCELSLNNTPHNKLLPVFYVICNVLHANTEDALAEQHGYYIQDEKICYSKKVAKHTNVLVASDRIIPSLTNELEICKQTIREILDFGMVARTIEKLQNINYNSSEFSEMSLFEATGIVVGQVGWRELATEKNIQETLGQISLNLTYGKQKLKFRLADISSRSCN